MALVTRLLTTPSNNWNDISNKDLAKDAKIDRVLAAAAMATFVALGTFALISGIFLLGGPLGIAYGFSAAILCAALTLGARDIYVMSNQLVKKEGARDFGKCVRITGDATGFHEPLRKRISDAAEKGGTLLPPSFFAWAVTPST